MESWRKELYENELYHHGISGQKWGVRRFQNEDGSVTPAGARRYYDGKGPNNVRWGLKRGERDITGATYYKPKTEAEAMYGGGEGGEGKRRSGEEDSGRQGTIADAQRIADQERADKAAWIASLKERVKNRPGNAEEKEEEKGSKSKKSSGSSGSSRSSGASMTPEQVAQALAKILGEDTAETKPKAEAEVKPAETEEEKAPEEAEPQEQAIPEEPVDENNLSEEEEKELSGYMVDPISSKVYRVDDETGDAYEVDPKTGKMTDKPVHLQKNKLNDLLESVRAGAENFRDAFTNVVNAFRAKRKGGGIIADKTVPGDTKDGRAVDAGKKSAASSGANKDSNVTAKTATIGKAISSVANATNNTIGNSLNSGKGSLKSSLGSALNQVRTNTAKERMIDSDASKLRSMVKAETNERSKGELAKLLQQAQLTVQRKKKR